jgi:phosphoglycolate phosphatase-like HAD superfamily hydrolase
MRSSAAMSSTAGRGLITDLDGTLVRLAVDWPALRGRLGVERVADLWRRGDVHAFAGVAEAEREGAERGPVNAAAVAFACTFAAVAVLTENSEGAVHRFLARVPVLRERCVAVVGREMLGGSKRDTRRFADAVQRCRQALSAHAAEPVTYLGDSAYELDFARALGLQAVDAAALGYGATMQQPRDQHGHETGADDRSGEQARLDAQEQLRAGGGDEHEHHRA